MEDLSSRLPMAALIGQSSMSATNGVSLESGSMTAPGSESEATSDITPRSPMPEIPAQSPRTSIVSGGESPSSEPWTSVAGRPWMAASDDEYLPPRDSGGRWSEQ